MDFIVPPLSTLFILISAIFVPIGWLLIVKGKKEAHKKAKITRH